MISAIGTSDVEHHRQEFLRKVHLEMLVNGNMTEQVSDRQDLFAGHLLLRT